MVDVDRIGVDDHGGVQGEHVPSGRPVGHDFAAVEHAGPGKREGTEAQSSKTGASPGGSIDHLRYVTVRRTEVGVPRREDEQVGVAGGLGTRKADEDGPLRRRHPRLRAPYDGLPRGVETLQPHFVEDRRRD